MISSISGIVIYHGISFVIIEVQGVGYKVTLPEDVAHGLSGSITLYTHEAQREDGRELFGFTTVKGLELCWKLIDVPGVGPKLAQKIVYGGRSVDEVREKIEKNDVGFLSSISGVGKKTAQKIVLELQGKLVNAPSVMVDEDALLGLIGLGYTRLAAEKALFEVDPELPVGEKIRLCLKLLSR